MNTNAYKAAIHKVHERTIYEPSNALPFYIRECGGGWACIESRHKDWRFYYLTINTRLTEPEVILQWSLNPQVIFESSKHKVQNYTKYNTTKSINIYSLRSFHFQVSADMMHKIHCTDCSSLRKCQIIHQTGLKVTRVFELYSCTFDVINHEHCL